MLNNVIARDSTYGVKAGPRAHGATGHGDIDLTVSRLASDFMLASCLMIRQVTYVIKYVPGPGMITSSSL